MKEEIEVNGLTVQRKKQKPNYYLSNGHSEESR